MSSNGVLPPGCPGNSTVCVGISCLESSNNFNQILSSVLSVVMTVMMGLVMFAMGCTVEVAKLWSHIRRPWGIVVGFLCQFGIMPFSAFALALAFDVLPLQAVVILIMGCCPGGSSSNILAYWMDGDMDLSISMTACSSILALGMMPLCLLIYTSTWTSTGTIQIPYQSIGITLVSLLVPTACGMYVKSKWPRAAKKILKVGSIMGIVLIVIIAVVGGLLYQSSWVISPSLWIIGAVYPLVGFGLGFLLARFVGQPWYRCRTIALETGFQNAQLCSTIVQLSFKTEELEVMFAFPLIYSIFQLLMAVGAVAVYQVFKRQHEGGAAQSSCCVESTMKDKHDFSLKNGGFEYDENGNTGAKLTHLLGASSLCKGKSYVRKRGKDDPCLKDA